MATMSTTSRSNSSGIDIKFSNDSPKSQTDNTNLVQSDHSTLNFVNESLDNIEPALAALSASTHHHHHNNSQHYHNHQANAISSISPVDIAASTLAHSAENSKVKRLMKACDACSRRKVKCDNDRPCRNCRDLSIECTFHRPTKRRGPINKVAEELKRLKRFHPIPDTIDPLTDPFLLTTESIAPLALINRVVLLYFTYVYPRFPFPHENMFFESLGNEIDIQDHGYISLLAAVIATTAAALPRLVRIALLEIGTDTQSLLPFIDRCIKVCTDARGSRFLIREHFTVHDANTSYLLALIGLLTNRLAQYRLYLAESLSILHLLDLKKKEGHTPINFVDSELAARLYSAIFTQMSTTAQFGPEYSLATMSINPPTKISMPVAADDFYIYYNRIMEQPEGAPPLISGANLITSIYVLSSNIKPEDSIENVLEALESLLNQAPEELKSPFGQEIALDVYLEDKERKQLRMELLKTAIKITWLSCRASVLTHFKSISKKIILRNEWENLASDASKFLKEMPNAYVELLATILVPQLKVFADSMVQALAENDEKDIERALITNTAENVAKVAMRVAELERDVLTPSRLSMEGSLNIISQDQDQDQDQNDNHDQEESIDTMTGIR